MTLVTEPAHQLSPLEALRRHWLIGLVLSLAGLAGGVVYASSQPTSYTAETRLAVGSTELTAYQIPGFALAAQQLAANYSRYVVDASANAQVQALLGDDVSGITGVGASPIPDSSIIRVEVTGESASGARRGADAVAANLRRQVAGSDPEAQSRALLEDYTTLSQDVASKQSTVSTLTGALARSRAQDASATALAAAQTRLTAAEAALSVAQVQQSALGQRYQDTVQATGGNNALSVIAPAIITSSDSRSRQERYGALGLFVGLLMSLVLSVLMDRRRSRREPRRISPRRARGQSADGPRTGLPDTAVEMDDEQAVTLEPSARTSNATAPQSPVDRSSEVPPVTAPLGALALPSGSALSGEPLVTSLGPSEPWHRREDAVDVDDA